MEVRERAGGRERGEERSSFTYMGTRTKLTRNTPVIT